MKKALIVLILAYSVSVAVAATVCPSVVCTSTNLNVNNYTGDQTICAERINNANGVQIEVATCNNTNLYCAGAAKLLDLTTETTFGNCLFKEQTGSLTKVLPGNNCGIENRCINDKECLSGICVGGKLNATCTTDANCDVGFFCLAVNATTSLCRAVSPPGGACGNDTTKCGFGTVCINTKCVKYLSLPVGAVVSSSSLAFAACSSLTTQVNGAEVACVAAPILQGGNQLFTNMTTPCSYVIPGQTTPLETLAPECLFSQTGSAVCSLGIGDVATEFQYIYNNYYSRDLTGICHVSQPVDVVCDNAMTGFALPKRLQAYLNVYGYNLNKDGSTPYVAGTGPLADNANCVKSEVTYSYWSLLDSAATVSLGASLVLGVIVALF